jgi:Bacterial lectin
VVKAPIRTRLLVVTSLFGLLVFAGGSGSASAAPQDAPCVPRVTLHGNAHKLRDRIRLTDIQLSQVGAAWSASRCLVASGFGVMFHFQITPHGADGMAFVVQNDSGSALGIGGGGMGYAGIPNSLAVEFDTFANFENHDPNSNHLSVHSRGTLPNDEDEIYSLGHSLLIPEVADGAVHTCWIRYIPGQLKIFVDTKQFARVTVAVDIPQLLGLPDGRAWLGVTAASGGVSETHDVLTLSL